MKVGIRGLLPIGVFLLIGLAFAIGLTKDPSELPSELIDRPLPEFELTGLFDPEQTFTQDDFLGTPVLMNVFGSWCAACVQEHPMLIEIARQNKVRLVGIDWRDRRENAQRWLARYGNPYETIIFDGDSSLAIDLGVTGAPESFLVDSSGRIRYKYVGVITPDIWENTLLPVLAALDETAS